jgi:hypothetical protein
MTNAQQNLENQCSHQFGDGNEMTIAQKIEFVKNQERESNETQKSAVDSVIEYFSQYVDMKKHVEEIEKFKEMEMEQHKKTALDSRKTIFDWRYPTFDQYFKHIYGGNK